MSTCKLPETKVQKQQGRARISGTSTYLKTLFFNSWVLQLLPGSTFLLPVSARCSSVARIESHRELDIIFGLNIKQIRCYSNLTRHVNP